MGGGQSVEVPGGGKEGYHVLKVCSLPKLALNFTFSAPCFKLLKVLDNSPGYHSGLQAFFDYIVSIDGVRLVSWY